MGQLHYFAQDMTGLAAATLLAFLLVVMPGFGIARLGERAALVAGKPLDRISWALLFAVSILPALDALLLRWTGFVGVLVPHLLLAAFGALPAFRSLRRIRPAWWLVAFACWLLVAWSNVDFDWNGKLNQSLIIIDTVKHAAVVAQLATSGLPLHDPFFSRQGIAGYYYYFYLAPALIHWLGGRLIDARAAFGAGTFVTLLAFPAMLYRLGFAARLVREDRPKRFVGILLLLCCVSGFDILPAIAIHRYSGFTLRQLDLWDEEVRWVLTSILWVPHHMSAVIAVFTGCLVLLETKASAPFRAAAAGVAFASAFGCSIWVALAAAPVLAGWWLWEAKRGNSPIAWPLPLSGVFALLVATPQVLDLAAGRAMGGSPLGLYIRSVGPLAHPADSIGDALFNIATLPGGYFFEFGVFALGTIAFMRRGGLEASRASPAGRLLLVAAPVGLLLATFVRSTIIYNDFGWRSIWFAQVPALLWTAALLFAPDERRFRSPLWQTALALGLCAVVWDMAGLRLIREPQFKVPVAYVNARPDVDYDVRGAYAWADRNLPATVMVQHNPNLPLRALDFGVYSDRPVPVSDVQGRLFGADQQAVRARLGLVSPIFTTEMPLGDVRSRASAAHAGALLLTAADPLWRQSGGPPSSWTCRYRSKFSCIMLVTQD